MKKNEQYLENRKKLKELSNAVKPLVKEGQFSTVNEALKEVIYQEQNPDIKEFNSFHSWKAKGKNILKGSKAFLFWGMPVKGKKQQSQDSEPDEFSFFPLCYLFADTQVK